MPEYEYVVLDIEKGRRPSFQELLSERGRDGWRLVAYYHTPGPDVSSPGGFVGPGKDIGIMERELRTDF